MRDGGGRAFCGSVVLLCVHLMAQLCWVEKAVKEGGCVGERSVGGAIRVCISIWKYPCGTSKIAPSSPKSSLSGTSLKCLCIYANALRYVCAVAK